MQLHLWLQMVHDKLRRQRSRQSTVPVIRVRKIPNAFNNRAGSIENGAVITFQYLYFNARSFHSVAMYLPSLRSNHLIEIPTRRKRFSRGRRATHILLISFVEFAFGVLSRGERKTFSFPRDISSCGTSSIQIRHLLLFLYANKTLLRISSSRYKTARK